MFIGRGFTERVCGRGRVYIAYHKTKCPHSPFIRRQYYAFGDPVMSPSWFLLSVALLLVAQYATGNLIRGKSDDSVFSSKDVPVPKDDVEGNELSIPAEPPVDPQESTPKKCGEIGDFVCICWLLFLEDGSILGNFGNSKITSYDNQLDDM